MASDNAPSTVNEIRDRLKGERTAMVTTVDERGTLSSRPVTVQEIDSAGDVWFLVSAEDQWVSPADGAPINTAIVDENSTWASFAGRAELVEDQGRIEELMDGMTESFFADGTTPVALRVATDRIEWWTSPGSVVSMINIAKSKVTNSKPDMGDSGTIEV